MKLDFSRDSGEQMGLEYPVIFRASKPTRQTSASSLALSGPARFQHLSRFPQIWWLKLAQDGVNAGRDLRPWRHHHSVSPRRTWIRPNDPTNVAQGEAARHKRNKTVPLEIETQPLFQRQNGSLSSPSTVCRLSFALSFADVTVVAK